MSIPIKKIDLFKKLGEYNDITNTSRFVQKDEFIGEFVSLFFNNGGNWCRQTSLSKSKYIFATMTANARKINILSKVSDEQALVIEKDFRDNCEIKSGNHVQYFKIFGKNNNEDKYNRNIRKDIKDFYKHKSCAHCGSNSNLECDHKNDLYNDPRVLNTKTQNKDDFQSLCKHCNDQKRQISVKTRATGIRYGATNIPSLAIDGIDYILGNSSFNINDINAMKGTYWYDPIEFRQTVKQLNEKKMLLKLSTFYKLESYKTMIDDSNNIVPTNHTNSIILQLNDEEITNILERMRL